MNPKKFLALVALIALTFIGIKLFAPKHDYKADWLRRMSGTNSLALTQIITGEEPYVLTFSIPLQMEVRLMGQEYKSTNNCWLFLMEDDQITGDFYRSNNTYYAKGGLGFSPPGTKHFFKVKLDAGFVKFFGPTLVVSYTNLFQFTDPNVFGENSLWIHFGLGIKQAGYKIDIFDTNKTLLSSIIGQTSNGTVSEKWDLEDSNHFIHMDDFFNAQFYIWHLHNITNQDAADDIPIPTNPCPFLYIRDKSSWNHH